jgi:hypothetical protein
MCSAIPEIHDLVPRITDTITTHCPSLLTHRGIGPDNAAALLITAGDNPDRSASNCQYLWIKIFLRRLPRWGC